MKPYSRDLRLRVLAAVDRGVVPREEVAKTFSVSVPTIKRFISKGAARVEMWSPSRSQADLA
jgi:transposase